MKLNFINDFKNLQNVTLFLSHYAQSPLFMKKTLSKIKGKKKKKRFRNTRHSIYEIIQQELLKNRSKRLTKHSRKT